MHKKLYLFLILIFILPTHFVHSNANNTIKERTISAALLNKRIIDKTVEASNI